MQRGARWARGSFCAQETSPRLDTLCLFIAQSPSHARISCRGDGRRWMHSETGEDDAKHSHGETRDTRNACSRKRPERHCVQLIRHHKNHRINTSGTGTFVTTRQSGPTYVATSSVKTPACESTYLTHPMRFNPASNMLMTAL